MFCIFITFFQVKKVKFKVLNIKLYNSKKVVFRTRKDLLITVTEQQFRSVTLTS